jgi:hypothetical protein
MLCSKVGGEDLVKKALACRSHFCSESGNPGAYAFCPRQLLEYIAPKFPGRGEDDAKETFRKNGADGSYMLGPLNDEAGAGFVVAAATLVNHEQDGKSTSEALTVVRRELWFGRWWEGRRGRR